MEATSAVRGRSAFVVRLMVALVFAALAVGVAQYLLVAETLRQTALDDVKRAHSADSSVIHDLSVGPDPDGAVAEIMGHIASRPGIEQAALLDATGQIAVLGMSHHGGMGPMASDGDSNASETGMPMGDGDSHAGETGMPMGDGDSEMAGATDHAPDAMAMAPSHQPQAREARRVAKTGEADASIAPSGHITVWVPVDVAGMPHVLEVVRDGKDLRDSVGALREVVLWTIGGGLVLILPIFYLVGGRTLASRHHEALESSTTDALTRLGNHRAFHDDLRRSIDLAHRHGRKLSLVLVDLDGFKQVNDTRGHAQGDRVLAAIGIVLRGGHPSDRPYRIGGDEFAVLLPETALEGAAVRAERIRSEVESGVDGVTTSIGIAELGIASPDASSLLELADRALYAAKEGGRNRVVRTDELQGPPARVTLSS